MTPTREKSPSAMPLSSLDERDVICRFQIEIHHDRLLVAAHDNAAQLLVVAGVELLVRHVRGDVDEVARAGLGGEFEPVTPAHPSPAAQDVDHALQLAVVMRASPGAWLDDHGAGPELLGRCRLAVDRGLAVHAGRLRRAGIKLVVAHYPHAELTPVGEGAGHSRLRGLAGMVDRKITRLTFPRRSRVTAGVRPYPAPPAWHRSC